MNDSAAIIDQIRKTLLGLGLEEVMDVRNLVTSKTREAEGTAESKENKGPPVVAAPAPAPGAAAQAPVQELPRTLRRFLVRTELEKVKLRIGRPLDLEADALVCDSVLGTLGIIHVIANDGANVDAELKGHIDKATYLSHLILESLHPGEPKARSAYTVELVFAIPADSTKSGSAQRTGARIGEALRDLVGQSTFLQAAGINVWDLGPTEPRLARSQVRRAFSWLLCEARQWWESDAQPAQTASVAPAGAPASSRNGDLITKLTLKDFRVPGTRTCSLLAPTADRQPLHVVHGPNGSGKSSLAEAVELAVTHRIERLEKQNHAKVVTNSAAWRQHRVAEIRLEFSSGSMLSGIVGRNAIKWRFPDTWKSAPQDWPAVAPCEAAAVRLDQKLADTLSQSLPQRRAEVLLRAFFSRDYEQIRKGKTALSEAEKIDAGFLQKLPSSTRQRFLSEKGQLDPERVLKELTWLRPTEVVWDKVMELPGLASGTLQALEPAMDASVRDYVSRKGTVTLSEAEAAAKIVEEGMRKMLEKLMPLKPHLEDATKVLENYGSQLEISQAPYIADPVKHFNEWLELVAIADLLEHEHLVLCTIEQARNASYMFQRAEQPVLAGKEHLPARQARLETLKRLREEARQRILELGKRSETAMVGRKAVISIERLNPEALDTLAAAGLFGSQFQELDRPLAAALRQAIRERKVQEVRLKGSGVLRIGESGWGSSLTHQTKAITQSMSELSSKSGALGFSGLLMSLRRLREVAETLSQVSREAQKRLCEVLQEGGALSNAINELVALLTPARWAYEDTISRLNLEGASESLDMQGRDGIPTSLRLNTAELNALALAMFLLCARHSPNPLRLIVLDDPLQNMDELTVTTVARGLGKIMRLWREQDREDKAPWRVLLLLHSEEDVERIRNEVPCVTHVLQWLSPDAQSDLAAAEVRIKRQPSLLENQLQALEQLIRPGA